MSENNLRDKADTFALRSVKCSTHLKKQWKEYVIADQILRCGTSIGANIYESKFAQSNADYISKLSIALKEASETCFWLNLIHSSEFIDDHTFESMSDEVEQLIKILVTIIKKLKEKEEKKPQH